MSRLYILTNLVILSCIICSCTNDRSLNLTPYHDVLIVDRTPTNPNATEAAHSVLATLADLTEGKQAGVISGQNLGHGIEIVDTYKKYITTIDEVSGEKPGMLGLDYEFQRKYSLQELLNANQTLIKHWETGGWITINYSPNNPWERGSTFESIFTQFPEADLSELIHSGSDANRKWLSRLDVIATALKNLEDYGVVVLWRPMQEMNGDWFWWGKKSLKENEKLPGAVTNKNPNLARPHQEYINLFRHMHDYFTRVKKLNNLLWVFSPNYDHAFSAYPYPGDDVVDIVAPTEYSDTLKMIGYTDSLNYKKPVGFSEWGQATWEKKIKDGALDNRLYVKRLKEKFPRAAYWVTWHSWHQAPVALIDNLHTKELMNDAYLINHGAREAEILPKNKAKIIAK